MACYSRISVTTMTDAARLAEALAAAGYTSSVEVRGTTTAVTVRRGDSYLGQFVQPGVGAAFQTGTFAQNDINAVQRKYSEIGVRAWATRNGFSVAGVENQGRKLTLVNRRG